MLDFGVVLMLLLRCVTPAGVLTFLELSSKLSSSSKLQHFSSLRVVIFRLGFSVRCFSIIWLYWREPFFDFGGIATAAVFVAAV